jgi:glyoxylase-like metal-dependent hydrolase (beta-lactamase superfamily II)
MKKPPRVSLTRRRLMQGLGFCVAASTLQAAPAFARAAPATLTSELLAPDVLWIRGAGCNVLALRDARGLAFIDGGLAAQSGAVLAHARQKLGRDEAHTLINTHWHPEHVGLNETLGKSGAKIIAHENTRLWLGAEVERVLDGPPVRPLPAQARPNATTYGEDEIAIGDEVVHYGYLSQAHTDGDLYVHLRKANVLIAGGVIAGNGWSVVDYVTGGWINGMVAGYRTLAQQCTAETRVISAHGERVLTRKDVEDERAVLAKLSEQLGKMLRSGFGPADVIAAAPAKEYEARYGDPTEFLEQSFRSLWGHMAPDA